MRRTSDRFDEIPMGVYVRYIRNSGSLDSTAIFFVTGCKGLYFETQLLISSSSLEKVKCFFFFFHPSKSKWRLLWNPLDLHQISNKLSAQNKYHEDTREPRLQYRRAPTEFFGAWYRVYRTSSYSQSYSERLVSARRMYLLSEYEESFLFPSPLVPQTSPVSPVLQFSVWCAINACVCNTAKPRISKQNAPPSSMWSLFVPVTTLCGADLTLFFFYFFLYSIYSKFQCANYLILVLLLCKRIWEITRVSFEVLQGLAFGAIRSRYTRDTKQTSKIFPDLICSKRKKNQVVQKICVLFAISIDNRFADAFELGVDLDGALAPFGRTHHVRKNTFASHLYMQRCADGAPCKRTGRRTHLFYLRKIRASLDLAGSDSILATNGGVVWHRASQYPNVNAIFCRRCVQQLTLRCFNLVRVLWSKSRHFMCSRD